MADESKRRVRISVRAVVAGALVELALVGLMMVLARAAGWTPAVGIPLGAWLAAFGLIAWLVGGFVGGYLSAVVSRSIDRRDGVVHGVVTWAAACASATVAARAWLVAALAVGLVDLDAINTFDTPRMMIALFVAQALGLAAAIAGGLAGSRAERAHELGAPAASRPRAEPRPTDQLQPVR